MKAIALGELQRIVNALPMSLQGIRDRALLLIGWTAAFQPTRPLPVVLSSVAPSPTSTNGAQYAGWTSASLPALMSLSMAFCNACARSTLGRQDYKSVAIMGVANLAGHRGVLAGTFDQPAGVPPLAQYGNESRVPGIGI
jgi:hypothetical protein